MLGRESTYGSMTKSPLGAGTDPRAACHVINFEGIEGGARLEITPESAAMLGGLVNGGRLRRNRSYHDEEGVDYADTTQALGYRCRRRGAAAGGAGIETGRRGGHAEGDRRDGEADRRHRRCLRP